MAKEPDKSTKPLCFVIGPIGSAGTDQRKHSDMLLNLVIKRVLAADEFGYRVKRADEDADPGMIGDRVVTDIINAELVVADLTNLNANAFYELGIRHSTEKPTIHIAKAGTVLPFDNISHRTITVDLTDWQSIVDAETKLAASARAITEPSYKVSNPITQANASFKMRESADPKDQLIAQLRERMTSVESMLENLDSLALYRGIDAAANRRRPVGSVYFDPNGSDAKTFRSVRDMLAHGVEREKVSHFIFANLDRKNRPVEEVEFTKNGVTIAFSDSIVVIGPGEWTSRVRTKM